MSLNLIDQAAQRKRIDDLLANPVESAKELEQLRLKLAAAHEKNNELFVSRALVHTKLAEALAACKVKDEALESISALGIMDIYNGTPHWIFPIKVMQRANEALAATTDLKDVVLCHAEPVGFRAFNEPQSCWEYGREPEDTRGTYSLEPEPLYRAWEPK